MTDVAIIGGGLSGLTAAYLLHQGGIGAHLYEASDRLGGRIDSLRDQAGNAVADLGPTWIWPRYQPNVAKWTDRLGLHSYPQFEAGDGVLDMHPGGLPSRQLLPGQRGIARIMGGPMAYIDALSQAIPSTHVTCNAAVTSVTQDGGKVLLEFVDGQIVRADHVIFATPLRVMLEGIKWNGLLHPETRSILQNAPTWMAHQIKVSMTFATPFWRDRGFSGRLASRIGPLSEAHDHSGVDGSPAALFGFVADPAYWRLHGGLSDAVTSQMQRCFGDEAAHPLQFGVKDWGKMRYICAQRDLISAPDHPSRLPDLIRQKSSDGRIQFAVAETALHSPGLIDGALEAGTRAARSFLNMQKH